MSLDPAFVAILVCPTCKQALIEAHDTLVCTACRLEFPVVDGVPLLLAEEARPLTPGDVERVRSAVKSRP